MGYMFVCAPVCAGVFANMPLLIVTPFSFVEEHAESNKRTESTAMVFKIFMRDFFKPF